MSDQYIPFVSHVDGNNVKEIAENPRKYLLEIRCGHDHYPPQLNDEDED